MKDLDILRSYGVDTTDLRKILGQWIDRGIIIAPFHQMSQKLVKSGSESEIENMLGWHLPCYLKWKKEHDD